MDNAHQKLWQGYKPVCYPLQRQDALKNQRNIIYTNYLTLFAQREPAAAMLGRLGYRLDAVSSGEAAIDYLKTKQADLVVLDMIMEPGMDGLETYEKILENNLCQRTFIVSGYAETGRVRKAQEMGAGQFVSKPYIMKKNGMAIRAELDRK